VQAFDDRNGGTVCERVKDRLGLASCPHEAVGAQHGEVLGQCRLRQIDFFVELAHRAFAFCQQAENQQAALVAERTQETRSVGGMHTHLVQAPVSFHRCSHSTAGRSVRPRHVSGNR